MEIEYDNENNFYSKVENPESYSNYPVIEDIAANRSKINL